MSIKNLPTTWVGKGEVKGCIFTKIKESEKAFIYRVESGDRSYYEVFKRKAKTNSTYYCYPTSKAFGIWAWCCTSMVRALEKFKELEGKE